MLFNCFINQNTNKENQKSKNFTFIVKAPIKVITTATTLTVN